MYKTGQKDMKSDSQQADNCLWLCPSTLQNLYLLQEVKKDTIIATIHVDNFLSIASLEAANEEFKDQLRRHWTISDLGTPKHMVGIGIK